MALESTQRPNSAAARVVVLAGRFATSPRTRPAAAIHLVHGTADAVIPCLHSKQAAIRIAQLGGTVSLDLLLGLGHGVDERAVRQALIRLAPEPA